MGPIVVGLKIQWTLVRAGSVPPRVQMKKDQSESFGFFVPSFLPNLFE